MLGTDGNGRITAAYLVKTAILAALSFVMYMYLKFPLPFMFPGFLEMNFSELPAVLAGFAMGPVSGCVVIVVRTALKLPFTSTAFVGELTDLALGLCYVLPAAITYRLRKSKRGAALGLILGTVCSTVAAIILNRFVSIPFYTKFYFDGDFDVIVGICRSLYKGVNRRNFYAVYLFAAVLPFNVLRLGLVGGVTFAVYKKLSRALHFEFSGRRRGE